MMRTRISLRNVVALRAVIGMALLVSPIMAGGQTPSLDVIKHGAKVFATNCSFCHGEGGIGHNAPPLIDRGLDEQHIKQVITYGKKETAMAAWGQLLSAKDLDSVVAYVKGINGIAASANANASPALSAEVARGRTLFRDATRELGACSNCHAVDGRGVNIVPLKNIPLAVTALRSLATTQMKTVVVDGERFPGLIVTQSRDETKLYDFTTVPAVLRTFATSAVKVKDGSTWQHVAVLGTTYSDQELDLVLGYLRAAGKP